MPKHHSPARSAAHISPLLRNSLGKRRSTRMGLHAAVGLSGHDRHKASFTTDAKATNLNKHGAAVQLQRELPVGSTITLRNKLGVQVSARVVSQISAVEGLRTYGVEFLVQDEQAKQFWGISFPSA
ncbi:MAG TPA: PilZ domain-containing protein [Candidatus Sulfotelmatobacter sp.]|nr:PilZ domain-containing protein [Candidatus Sulfotelmatobacter sp.]